MTGCSILAIDKCFGWAVPDWLVPLLPYWPWLAVVIGCGVAYRLAGAPGLAAFAAAVGFVLGRRSADEFYENVGGKDAQKSPPKPKRKTLLK